MAENKKIPCRVCGKLFEPCSYCQAHADVFRWRNFACSRECATKYINDTIAYRESLKHNDKNVDVIQTETTNEEVSARKNTTTKRKYNKKISTESVEIGSEIKIENNETE